MYVARLFQLSTANSSQSCRYCLIDMKLTYGRRRAMVATIVEGPRGEMKIVELRSAYSPPPVAYSSGPSEEDRREQLRQYKRTPIGKLDEKSLLAVFTQLAKHDTAFDNCHIHPIVRCLRVCRFWGKVASTSTLWTRIHIGCSAKCTEAYLTRSAQQSLSIHCSRVPYRRPFYSFDAPAKLVRKELHRVEEVYLEDDQHSGRVVAILAGIRGPDAERLRILRVIMDYRGRYVWPDDGKVARSLLEPEYNRQHLHFQGIVSKGITCSMHGLRSLSLGNIFTVSLTELLRGIAACPFLEGLRLDVLQADVLVQEFQRELLMRAALSLMRVALPQLSCLQVITSPEYSEIFVELISYLDVPDTCRREISSTVGN